MAVTRRVPQILFLIADTGGGHRAAANAIRAAMQLIAPETHPSDGAPPTTIPPGAFAFDPHDLIPKGWGGATRAWHAEIHDIIAECGSRTLQRTANMYGPLVTHRPRVYASVWHATNTRTTYAAVSSVTMRMLRRRFADMLLTIRPDVIVSVHSLLTQPTLGVLAGLGVRPPFLTVVTDLVRFHRSWAQPDVDVCAVPTPAARDLVAAFGMPVEKIRLLGMPIHPKFCLPSVEPAVIRTNLGLQPDRFTVLLVGGGEGLGRLGEFARAIAAAHVPVQMIVIAGRNRALLAELEAERAAWDLPAAVLGFVENMPDLMHAADVIITKAGPGTIAESLACGLPIILTGAIPGQEVGNIDYVIDQHVGVLARTPESVVAAVRDLAASTPEELARLRAHALSLSHPRAAFDIASLILSYLPAASTVSVWDRVALTRRRRRQPLGRRPARGQRIPVPRWRRARHARPATSVPGGRWRRLAMLVRRRRRPSPLS
jgi:1,2-diacylglycerol 3-beta-galactosyltransferase